MQELNGKQWQQQAGLIEAPSATISTLGNGHDHFPHAVLLHTPLLFPCNYVEIYLIRSGSGT